MNQRLINLTCQLVIQEVEEILRGYPPNTYYSTFIIQVWRQKLINHVLNQIPNHYYTILEEEQELPQDARFLYSSLAEQLQMEALIHESMLDLIQQHSK